MTLAVHDALLSFARRTPHEALVVLDAEGRVVAWLGAAAALTGFDEAEVRGHPLPPPLVADGAPPASAELCEWQLRHKDGRPVRVLACAIAVIDVPDGVPVWRVLQWRPLAPAAPGGDRPGHSVAHDLRNHLGAIGNATAVIEMMAPDLRLQRPLAVIRRQLEALAVLADQLRARPAAAVVQPAPSAAPARAADERAAGAGDGHGAAAGALAGESAAVGRAAPGAGLLSGGSELGNERGNDQRDDWQREDVPRDTPRDEQLQRQRSQEQRAGAPHDGRPPAESRGAALPSDRQPNDERRADAQRSERQRSDTPRVDSQPVLAAGAAAARRPR